MKGKTNLTQIYIYIYLRTKIAKIIFYGRK